MLACSRGRGGGVSGSFDSPSPQGDSSPDLRCNPSNSRSLSNLKRGKGRSSKRSDLEVAV